MTRRQSNYIKLIAIISMLIDHIGVVLLPEYIILRVIGRISFPLFAYQIGIGYFYTRNFKRYFLRLLGFGTAIQLCFVVAILFFRLDSDYGYLNIFFTLALGLVSIHFFTTKQYIPLAVVIVSVALLGFTSINIDYGFYGVALILSLYIFRDNNSLLCISMATLSFGFCFSQDYYIQMFCLVSLFFIIRPLEIRCQISAKLFYLFYPIHLAVLHLISIVI